VKKTLKVILILSVILFSILFSSLSAQQTDTTQTKRYGLVYFNYHKAQWAFVEISDKPLVYYDVYFNANGVSGYELWEADRKIQICKVYYNSKFAKIDKFEIFNGQKVSQTTLFIYDDKGKLIEIHDYKHDGKVIYLERKHFYNIYRYKQEVYEMDKLRQEYYYWDSEFEQVKLCGNYDESGKKTGPWTYISRFGNTEKEEEYVNGKVIATRLYEYGEQGERLKKTTLDDKGNVIYTIIYKYDFNISKTDAIEIKQYSGNEKTGKLQSQTYATFDKKTKEFIGMIKYNSKCEILSISIITYPSGPEGEGIWIKLEDKKEIKAYLSKFNYESPCRI